MKLRTLTLAVSAVFLTSVAFAQRTPAKPQDPVTVPCNGPSGARFNLEPRNNAVAQNQPNADFLLNRVAPDADLIVQAANDFRGNLTTAQWDGSVSGYYVHSSTTADCSAQFEGGLPAFTSGEVVYTGVGNPVVAADPARDAIFIADARSGPNSTEFGVGLFRASASTLLNPAACPSGTHTAAQAASCWESRPPALVFSGIGGFPQIAVDERATSAGKGAGDVYSITENGAGAAVSLVACTNSLASCSSTVSIGSPLSGPTGLDYVKVRTDGLITISFANANGGLTGLQSDDIFFVSCQPAGAPNPPSCVTPTLVQHVASPINSTFSPLFPLANINLLMFTYPKHSSRAETGGKFTTFLVYDDCKSPFQFENPPISVCVDAEVMMVTSTDNGQTWSQPVSVDTASGHHFYPAISTDTSTGIVNLAYYSTEGDIFHHAVRVFRNQILPGNISAGTPQPMTTLLNVIDPRPQEVNQSQIDFFMGVIARGDSITGQSHLYTSFDSTAVSGTYNGRPLPELNNHIGMITY
ncbi:MAG: sialidase family protein [Candidatus Sulfotelmatobacter sp.]|jgi:hypothetical protein